MGLTVDDQPPRVDLLLPDQSSQSQGAAARSPAAEAVRSAVVVRQEEDAVLSGLCFKPDEVAELVRTLGGKLSERGQSTARLRLSVSPSLC